MRRNSRARRSTDACAFRNAPAVRPYTPTLAVFADRLRVVCDARTVARCAAMHSAFDEFSAIDVPTNGIRLRVRTAGQGDRLALLLHGFPECWFSWRYQMPVLARLGYRVWAPNLRGYGDSDRPAGVAAYRMEVLIDDVAGLIDAAGAREVVLVAHDWGAIIAWTFAARRIRPIDRLVVVNMAYPAVLARELRTNFGQFLRSWYFFFFQLPWLPERLLALGDHRGITRAFSTRTNDPSKFPPDVLEVYRHNAALPGALTAMINYYRAAWRYRSWLDDLRSVTVAPPSLLVWGDADRVQGLPLVGKTEAYLDDGTTRILPGVSHWAQQEAPETVNALIEAWLTEPADTKR